MTGNSEIDRWVTDLPELLPPLLDLEPVLGDLLLEAGEGVDGGVECGHRLGGVAVLSHAHQLEGGGQSGVVVPRQLGHGGRHLEVNLTFICLLFYFFSRF